MDQNILPADPGLVRARDLGDGRALEVWPLTFGRARLQLLAVHVPAPGLRTLDVLDEW